MARTVHNRAMVVFLAVAGLVLLAGAAAPAAADHGDIGNLTITLPEASDNQPGDQNPEGATVRYFFQGADAFESAGAPDGMYVDAIFVESDDIDFSACGVGNIAAFGLDRGGNNSGTEIDDDLVQHMRSNDFRESGLYLRFYQEEDFGGDPIFINPEDAIRAQQGSGSPDGPCYTMPEEPGWYQVTGYLNGTTPEGEYAEESTTSHYFYVCDCEDESEARAQLGPPPSEDDSSEQEASTPTPEPETETPTPEPDTPEPETETPTPESDSPESEADESTSTPEPDTPAPETETPESAPVDDGQQTQSDDEPLTTPTIADGAGFGVVGALTALVLTFLLIGRND